MQVLKDKVRGSIERAALEVFAEIGYRRGTVAEIARRAQVSTGNVYRYFGGKRALFEAVVPPQTACRLRQLVRRRVRSLSGSGDVSVLEASAPFLAAAEDLMRFCLAHRLEVVVLLHRAEGTRYEGFVAELKGELERLAVSHFRALDPKLVVTRAHRFHLDLIYRSFLAAMVEILTSSEDEREIRQLIATYSRYHLAGLRALFEIWPEHDSAVGGLPR